MMLWATVALQSTWRWKVKAPHRLAASHHVNKRPEHDFSHAPKQKVPKSAILAPDKLNTAATTPPQGLNLTTWRA
jgi:hypothetical protein